MSVVRIKLEDLLRKMKGKPFLYNANPITILTFDFKGLECTVATDSKIFHDTIDNMLDILQDDFKPQSTEEDEREEEEMEEAEIEEMEPPGAVSVLAEVKPARPSMPAQTSKPVKPAKQVPQAASVKLFPKLTAALLDNIERIKADRDYCEQAQQVSLSVKMFVDLARTEIDSLRVTNELTGL